MRQSFRTLGLGILLAALLVYLLMVGNFQSWLEPLIIMLAVPGALAGALWMLAITKTTINVGSLMGMIMAVGVGVTASASNPSLHKAHHQYQDVSPSMLLAGLGHRPSTKQTSK